MNEKTYRVVLVDKPTGSRIVYQSGMTEAQAESVCEAWGWNYIDDDGKSYWIEYEEEEQEVTAND